MKPPWTWIETARIPNKKMPGMIEVGERRALYWAAQSFFRGRGALVEIGAFAGLSTYCFGCGLRDNANRGEQKVYSYDRFLIDDDNASYNAWFPQLENDFRGSFLHLYEEYIAEVKDYVITRPGDILEQQWNDGDIEIMFQDCSVSRGLVAHCYDAFFPKMLDGGLVIFQDFFYYRSYYLSVLSVLLSSNLIYLGRADRSAIFMVRDPSVFQTKFDMIVPPDDQLLPYMDGLIAEMGGFCTEAGQILASQKMFLARKLGKNDEAERTFQRLAMSPLPQFVQNDIVDALRSQPDG